MIIISHPVVEVNAKDLKGDTVLLAAVRTRKPQLVRKLLEKPGIDLHARDREGKKAEELANKVGFYWS